ncbi:AAA family ATPase [Burkholderia sp. Tr-20390]|uniref:McrB family protein n=1 Tax=Burkholderia sp. Tr-20390 TaxID=2703904 RepID=UPI00197F27A0|nr:AAA family ATPase [Burkholderia sp. Tr-20390]MBN3735407.1 AAA domain-containing protein [Burkholderia sp. Tr-20390]
MQNLLQLLRSKAVAESSALKPQALAELEQIFPSPMWGISENDDAYTSANFKNLWDNELRKPLQRFLAQQHVDSEAYGRWLGEIHYHSFSIYLTAAFPGGYRDNVGWRISIFSIPGVSASLVGLASHYQQAMNHNALGRASALLLETARLGLEASNPSLQLPGRAVEGTDWDGGSLLSSPILRVCDVDISSVDPSGLSIKGARTTTAKKTIASFISVTPAFDSMDAARARSELERLRDAAIYLSEHTYPFNNLEDFEQLRSIALTDLSAAGIRLRLKAGSATKSVVRVYYGPPGTGKTLTAVKEAIRLIDPTFQGSVADAFTRFNESHEKCCFLTFHPSLQYYDLVESIRPTLTNDSKEVASQDALGDDEQEQPESDSSADSNEPQLVPQALRYDVFEGPVLRMVRRAQKDPRGNYVIVIDEINRGDLSRVLGPLISSLEADKRAGSDFPIGYELQYPQNGEDGRLYLPSNLHILGTMNSTDRNVALVDYALRRRFDFVEIPPEPELLVTTVDETPIDCAALLRMLNQRIAYLLDDNHRLGHGFLMGCRNNRDVFERLAKKVIPQLREYFFGNEGLLLLIFGEAESHEFKLFRQDSNSAAFSDLFGVPQDVAASHGFRSASRAVHLKLDARFWSEDAMPPGPTDAVYAAQCVRKVYGHQESSSVQSS